MRRKLSAPEWRFPRGMTFKQWSVLPYRERHAYLAQAQCTLLEYWRDCTNALPPRAALPRAAAVLLGAQAGDAAGRMGEGGSRLPAAACAVVARLPQRLGRPVAVLRFPHPPPRAARGRGTARSAVEGACGGEASLEARAPFTALRAVPLPRFAGQD
jgi:hypothetical protein